MIAMKIMEFVSKTLIAGSIPIGLLSECNFAIHSESYYAKCCLISLLLGIFSLAVSLYNQTLLQKHGGYDKEVSR